MAGTARRLPRELEPVEFRRVPGLRGSPDDDVLDYWDREPLWRWLGLYPLMAFIAIYLAMIGMT